MSSIDDIYSELHPIQSVPHSYSRFGRVEFYKPRRKTVAANGYQNGATVLLEFKHGHSRMGPGAFNLTKFLKNMNRARKLFSGDLLPYESSLVEGLEYLQSLKDDYNNFVDMKGRETNITHRKL